jgi:uncharacterized protein (UPF0264 family)
MFKMKTNEEVEVMTKKLLKTLKGTKVGLIVAGYADSKRCGSISPFEFLPSVHGAEFLMLDTAIKDGKSILDFVSLHDLQEFKEQTKSLGLKLIVAGSIRYPELGLIKDLRPDVLGFRGIVCEKGEVKKSLVKKLVRELK